ncbi:hypothetical protein D9M73_251890 [compost metagenome]
MVGLAKLEVQFQLIGGLPAQAGDIGQGFVTVGGRLAGAEHIEVGAVEHQDSTTHLETPLLFFDRAGSR